MRNFLILSAVFTIFLISPMSKGAAFAAEPTYENVTCSYPGNSVEVTDDVVGFANRLYFRLDEFHRQGMKTGLEFLVVAGGEPENPSLAAKRAENIQTYLLQKFPGARVITSDRGLINQATVKADISFPGIARETVVMIDKTWFFILAALILLTVALISYLLGRRNTPEKETVVVPSPGIVPASIEPQVSEEIEMTSPALTVAASAIEDIIHPPRPLVVTDDPEPVEVKWCMIEEWPELEVLIQLGSDGRWISGFRRRDGQFHSFEDEARLIYYLKSEALSDVDESQKYHLLAQGLIRRAVETPIARPAVHLTPEDLETRH